MKRLRLSSLDRFRALRVELISSSLMFFLQTALMLLSFAHAEEAKPTPDFSQSQGQVPVRSSQGSQKLEGYYNSKHKRSRVTYDHSEEVADRRTLRLTTGEDKAIDLTFEPSLKENGGVIIGNPQVVATTLVKIGEKTQIVFKPLKVGETTVTIRDAEGNIGIIFLVRVTGTNLDRIKSEISSLLTDIEGIKIHVVGQKVVVEGEVLVPSDYGRLFAVVSDKVYADYVLNLTSLSPMAMQFLANRIQTDISVFAPNVKTRVVNGMIFLEGTTNTLDEAKRANQIALLYLPEVRPGELIEKDVTAHHFEKRSLVYNFIMVNPPPARKTEKLVRVTVHFVELRKDYSKLFGFQWMPGFTSDPAISVGQNAAGAANASSGNASFSGTISSLLPKLESAQNAGFARVLKTGTLIVRSGQPARLNEQTEFPFTVMGANGVASTASKQVGLAIAITPQILGQSEDIQMDMEIDQTDLVGRAPTNGSAPVTTTHKVVTKVYVKSSESAAVAGITSHDVGTDFNKDAPLVGSFSSANGSTATTVPLFNLLHSKAYRKQKSNFVIFVTPQIVENASEGTEDLKKNFRVKVN